MTTTAESAPPPPSPSPPPPSSSTCSGQPFCADWETGDFTQWAIAPLSDGTGTVTVSSSQPVRQGAYSARFRTAPATGTQRAEVNASQAQTGGYPGQEWWYGWWTYFPAAGNPSGWWTSSGDSNVIAQFQSVDWTTQIYIGIDQGNYTPGHTTIYMNWRGDAKSTLVQDLQYDHWYHFVVHAKWSTDPAVGFLSVDVDGATAKPLTYGATLANATTSKNPAWTAPGAYAELDNYHAGVPFENTVIHDGFCRAATSAAAEGC